MAPTAGIKSPFLWKRFLCVVWSENLSVCVIAALFRKFVCSFWSVVCSTSFRSGNWVALTTKGKSLEKEFLHLHSRGGRGERGDICLFINALSHYRHTLLSNSLLVSSRYSNRSNGQVSLTF